MDKINIGDIGAKATVAGLEAIRSVFKQNYEVIAESENIAVLALFQGVAQFILLELSKPSLLNTDSPLAEKLKFIDQTLGYLKSNLTEMALIGEEKTDVQH